MATLLMKQDGHRFLMAERLGFEPRVHCCTHAFQACSLSRSDTSP